MKRRHHEVIIRNQATKVITMFLELQVIKNQNNKRKGEFISKNFILIVLSFKMFIYTKEKRKKNACMRNHFGTEIDIKISFLLKER